MPFAIHRGQRIHYTCEARARWWCCCMRCCSTRRAGELPGSIDQLEDRFRLVCIDLLGHGDSDKPLDASSTTSRNAPAT